MLKRSELETQSVATRVIQANRKTAVQSSLVVVLAVLLSAVTTATIVFTRPTHVKHDAASSALVDATNQIVATNVAKTVTSIEQVASFGEEYDYNSIESVKVKIYVNETGTTSILGYASRDIACRSSTMLLQLCLYLSCAHGLMFSSRRSIVSGPSASTGTTPRTSISSLRPA